MRQEVGMQDTHHPAKRPRLVWALFALLLFVGITALGGGIEMVLFPDGNQFVSGEWLDGLPFDNWIIPGLVLGIGFGIGSLLAAFGLLFRSDIQVLRSIPPNNLHWSWSLTVALGFGLILWIGVEVLLIPERSVIEALYGVTAVVLVLLAWSQSVRTYLRTPHQPLKAS